MAKKTKTDPLAGWSMLQKKELGGMRETWTSPDGRLAVSGRPNDGGNPWHAYLIEAGRQPNTVSHTLLQGKTPSGLPKTRWFKTPGAAAAAALKQWPAPAEPKTPPAPQLSDSQVLRGLAASLTPTQFKALWAAFDRNGAWYGRQGGAMGGAYRRMCLRMAEGKLALVSRQPPYPITVTGMRVLREACHARWAKHGCMAYQDDLKKVEDALRSAGISWE